MNCMQALHMKNNYAKESESIVTSVKDSDNGNQFVVLDKTPFYPNSGGQPHDTGVLVRDGEEYKVVYAGKFGNDISHEVEKSALKKNDKVIAKIDWDRRYKFMRSHSASHVLSGVIFNKFGAVITGNQISENGVRIDFNSESFNKERVKEIEDECNKIIDEKREINIKFLTREEAFEIPSVFRLAKDLPESIKEFRIVEIEDFDAQACAGSHVGNTNEIVGIEILRTKNKGKNNRRIYFRLK